MNLYKFIKWVRRIKIGKFTIKLSVDSKHIHKEILKDK